MKISKVREVKLPSRGTEKSSGIDFFVPFFNEKFITDFKAKNPNIQFYIEFKGHDSTTPSLHAILLKPHQRVLIPSGIHINLSTVEGFPIKGKIAVDLCAHNKSGVSIKKGLDLLPVLIDQDYQGELHIGLVNTGTEDILIEENEKITQFVLRPVILDTIEEVDFSTLYSETTERGTGGFGSTNK